jgi:signal transduction histidine kinase
VRDKEGNLAGVVYVLRDKSREKEIEILKTDFVRAVSHEFRTPLSAIVGMAEMLLDGEVEKEKEKDYLRTVLEEGKRLSEMVSDVLDVARIESGKEVFRAEEVDFNQVLASVRDALQSPARAKNITLDTLTEGEIRGYIGDQEKIKHAIINLVENSLIYSDRGRRVNVSVKGYPDKITISVDDEGWGIPEEDIPHLGEKFFRGRYASKTKGTGLGFALVKRIIEMHGGSISVKSTLGVGTKVIVELPKGRLKEESL